jgi:hypothetical protein
METAPSPWIRIELDAPLDCSELQGADVLFVSAVSGGLVLQRIGFTDTQPYPVAHSIQVSLSNSPLSTGHTGTAFSPGFLNSKI